MGKSIFSPELKPIQSCIVTAWPSILEIRLCLWIHSPSLWAVPGSPHVYKVHRCGSLPLEAEENPHSKLPRRLARSSPVRGGVTISQSPAPQPPEMPGAQGERCQECAVPQPTCFVPGNNVRLSAHESDGHDGARCSSLTARGLLQSQCLPPPLAVSEAAGPYGFSVSSTMLGLYWAVQYWLKPRVPSQSCFFRKRRK